MKSVLAAAIAIGLAATSSATAADLGYGESDYTYGSDSETYAGDDYPVPSGNVGGDDVEPAQPASEAYFDEQGTGYRPAYRRHRPRHAGTCLTRRGLRANLINQGWRDLRGVAADPDVVGVTASRPNGLVYRLKIDRCSGVILAAYLLDQGAGEAYAYGTQDVPSY
ncbi:MAG: hypothetical protein R3D57_14485 [Hyphomicrobiaceae bacterium]